MVEIDLNDLDADEFLLNTPSATYDLRKGMKAPIEPDPSNFITKQTSLDPDDKGMEIWKDMLDLTFQNDKDLIEYVQR